jgi:spoIIIJ-associated protein
MSSERTVEATGESVEQAIANGLAELGGVSPHDVIVEVLDEPSRGVFGLGARPARVRLKLFRAPVAAAAPAPVSNVVEDTDAEDDEALPSLDSMEQVRDEALMAQDALIGKKVLAQLLDKMAIYDVEIVVRHAEASPDSEQNPWLLDITGSEVNALIGRRGETLAALQYIARLVASRELQHRANIVIDVEGYKARRSRMLRDLAVRMADQATRSRRVITLEPMPPYERRIIHLALRNRTDVQTRSVGEGSARKVTIVPK